MGRPTFLGRASESLRMVVAVLLVMELLPSGSWPVVGAVTSLPMPDRPTHRDPLKWPFASYSIWNLPIGSNAKFVPAGIAPAGAGGVIIEADPDVLLLYNTQDPEVPYYYNSAGWSGASRCAPQGGPKFTAPWPVDGFVVPSDGNNYAGAILMPDNTTIRQGQPLCCCVAGGNVTTIDGPFDVSLYTDGIRGAHGGTGLSSIGGTLRLGELMPIANGSSIVQPARHALKGNLFAHQNYWQGNRTTCFRWPANTCDGYFNDPSNSLQYGGTNPALRTGALLALNSTVDITKLGLQTTPALYLAWTLQNYGMYLADDSAWTAFALETELSPLGDYQKQFEAAWGFSFRAGSSSPWGQDVQVIFQNLNVVDNWDEDTYNSVKASNGTFGAGGGAPMQAWAPSLDSSTSSSLLSQSFLPWLLQILAIL